MYSYSVCTMPQAASRNPRSSEATSAAPKVISSFAHMMASGSGLDASEPSHDELAAAALRRGAPSASGSLTPVVWIVLRSIDPTVLTVECFHRSGPPNPGSIGGLTGTPACDNYITTPRAQERIWFALTGTWYATKDATIRRVHRDQNPPSPSFAVAVPVGGRCHRSYLRLMLLRSYVAGHALW